MSIEAPRNASMQDDARVETKGGPSKSEQRRRAVKDTRKARLFFIPALGRKVEAENAEEASKKAEEIINSDTNHA